MALTIAIVTSAAFEKRRRRRRRPAHADRPAHEEGGTVQVHCRVAIAPVVGRFFNILGVVVVIVVVFGGR